MSKLEFLLCYYILQQLPFPLLFQWLKKVALKSNWQPHRQDDKIKVIALATSTNFEKPIGPTVLASDSWKLSPPPKPKPDFDAVLAHKPDPNWAPHIYDGEILPMTGRLLILNGRGGFPDNGVCDAWNGFRGDERIDATYLAVMTEIMPSMTYTLTRNGGPYDARVPQERAEKWAQENPGVPLIMNPNSVAEVSSSVVCLSIITK